MRVLLNATSREIERLGGDFTLYRDWHKLSGPGLEFDLVPAHPMRSWSVPVRKALEKGCRTWQPPWLRRRLLLRSRFLYLPPKAWRGADMIYSHLLFPWAPFHAGTPIIWSSQGISPREYYDYYNHGQWDVDDLAWVYRVLGRRARTLVIATSACARNVIRWCPELADKVHVIPAPVFADASGRSAKPSLTDGVVRLLFTGVDAVRKGLPEVVDAFQTLRRRHNRVRLDIVSRPGPALRTRIGGIDGARLYTSSPDVDVKALMSRADVFVLPTHADTYALAVVEAMAHECAVITSDLEPLPEIVPQDQAGFNVPAGSVAALTESIEALLNNEGLLRRMQKDAYNLYLRRHHPDVVREELRAVLAAAIAGAERQPGKPT